MFQRSIQAAPHGVLIVDQAGIIQAVNQSLCKSFGYSEIELLDKKWKCYYRSAIKGITQHFVIHFIVNPVSEVWE
nr:PAS domain-containing protein [Ningiella sp. W23]